MKCSGPSAAINWVKTNPWDHKLKKILIPVYDENHWILAIVYPHDRRITSFDSINCNTGWGILGLLKEFVIALEHKWKGDHPKSGSCAGDLTHRNKTTIMVAGYVYVYWAAGQQPMKPWLRKSAQAAKI